MARKVMRGTVAAPRALFVMDRSGQPRRSDHVWTATHGGRVSGDMADTSPMLARRWPWGGRTGLCRYGRNDDDGCSERGSSQDERAFVESGFRSAHSAPMLARRWPWGGRTGLCRYGRNDDDGCSERGSSQDERAFVESGF